MASATTAEEALKPGPTGAPLGSSRTVTEPSSPPSARSRPSGLRENARTPGRAGAYHRARHEVDDATVVALHEQGAIPAVAEQPSRAVAVVRDQASRRDIHHHEPVGQDELTPIGVSALELDGKLCP